MKQRVHMARLGIALISFTNATAALAMPKVSFQGCVGVQAVIETTGSKIRAQRLPRVPRREPFESGPSEAAAGCD